VGHWWGGSLLDWGIRYSLFLAIATALGLIFHRSKLKFKGFFESQNILLIIFLGLVWLSIPLGFGLNPEESNAVKMTKVTIILLMASYVIINLKRYEMMVWTLILAGLYLGYEAFNAPGWMFSGGRLNVGIGGSDFSEGNFLGAHFAMLLPFLGVMFIKGSWKSKVLCLISGVFVTNSIILCRSRGIFLAILAGILTAIIFSIRRQRLKIFFGIGIAIVGAIFLTDPGFWRRMEGIETDAAQMDASTRGRLLAWEASLSMASDYPLGVGEGNFKKYIGQYNPEMIGRDTHNTFLRCLAELGIQGALILLLLIANAFWILFKLKKKIQHLPNKKDFLWHIYSLKIALAIYLVAGLFITHTYIEEFYWLLMYPVFLKRSVQNEIDVLHIPQTKGHQRSMRRSTFGRILSKTSKRYLLYLFVIPLIFFGSQYSTWSQTNPRFSSTYEQEALSNTEIPGIISVHPRLFLRSQPWRHGPNLTDLKMWAQQEPSKSYLKGKPWNPKPGREWAFRYLLTGDEKLVLPILEDMKKEDFYWPEKLIELAVLYDWLYNSPSFSANDKKIVEEKMLGWAKKAIETGQQYSDIWSHFGYRPPLDIAAAGLALYGHREEARKYIAMAGGYIKRNMFQGWALNDGAWQGGWAYYGQGCYNLFKFVAMWSSATSEDLFEIIEKKQGDWVRNHLYYLIYTMYPDHTPVESCGFNYAPDQRGGTSALLLLTGAYKDLNGLKNLNWRNEWGWRLGIDQFLYLSPELKKKEITEYDLPLTKLWGRKGLGYVQMRSGWGDGDTIIEFKCGDYFWSHQYNNQNSFTIYRKGRLAIQSGIYAGGYWGSHALSYYRPTISSNTILIIQPEEKTWIPPEIARREGIKANNGYFPEYGGQRSCHIMPEPGSAETCFTFDKYLYRKNNQHHFETGDIKAYEVTDRYSYVYGDATMAYNNPIFCYPGNRPKIDLFTRQLVFIDKKYLIIFDRVNSLSANYEKKWLLHSIGEPQLTAKPVQVEYPWHREVYEAGVARIDNKGGTLFCQTLFPEDYFIRKVGGNATVTPAKADPANKGNLTLRTTIQGKYERVSPTIASDSAQKEDWAIEFIDSDKFKIKGSFTGEDGVGSLKEDMFISNSQSIFILRENWQGSPIKGDKLYFSVTSPSHRFWVNGRNWHPEPSLKSTIPLLKDGSHIDPGNWRIEVFPKKKEKFNTFLHLLYPCDQDKASPPSCQGITTSNKVMKGVSIENWVLFFGYKGMIDQKIEYVIENKNNMTNLLLDMKPQKTYTIKTMGESSVSSQHKVVASQEGTLFFTVAGPCKIEIDPLM
jgi:O-antigen ligase